MCFLRSMCFLKVASYTIMSVSGCFPRRLQYYNKKIGAKKIRIVVKLLFPVITIDTDHLNTEKTISFRTFSLPILTMFAS